MRPEDLAAYVLTWNEEPNIARCLGALAWLPRVLVLDSGSTDRTREIALSFPNVQFVERPFDSHAAQHSHAAGLLSDSPWVLRLDADWLVTPEARDELLAIEPDAAATGIRFAFRLAVHGIVVRCAIYPPVVCVFRPGRAGYVQDGHTERLVPAGPVIDVQHRLLHDDRKSVERFVQSQLRYSLLELEKLNFERSPARRLSRAGLKRFMSRVPGASALAMALYLGVLRGGFFEGPQGRRYVMERVMAELILGLRLIEQRITASANSSRTLKS